MVTIHSLYTRARTHSTNENIKPCTAVRVSDCSCRVVHNTNVPEPLVPIRQHLSLAASGPDILQQTIALSKSVQRVVALAPGTDETAESVHLVLTGVTAVLVNLSDGDLHRGVILGLNDAVGCAALSWDVPAARKKKNQ